MPAASSASDLPVDFMTATTCNATISPSPVVVLSRTEQMPRGLAAKHAAMRAQHLQDVAVADGRAHERYAELLQCELETEIAHDRADDGTLEVARGEARFRQDIEQLVAVHGAAQMIHHHQPIAVAVECDAGIRPHAGHRQLQQPGIGRSAAVVDVAAVRRAADRHDFGAEIRDAPVARPCRPRRSRSR